MFELIEWRFLRTSDLANLSDYGGHKAWSRVYEYPISMEVIRSHQKKRKHNCRDFSILNTSCGFSALHSKYATDLRSLGRVANTDLHESNQAFDNYSIFDISDINHSRDIANSFDACLNISTIEEISGPKMQIIDNLLRTLRSGGILVATIDYTWLDPLLCQGPIITKLVNEVATKDLAGIQQIIDVKDLTELVQAFGRPSISRRNLAYSESLCSASRNGADEILNGANSLEPNINCALLSSLLLVIRKN